MHFSNRQKKLLKKLRRKPLSKTELNAAELSDLVYFGDNGLIRYETIHESEESLKVKDLIIHIQPKGEAECAYIIEERRRWLIPVLISIAALIISICAIVSSSQSVNVYIVDQDNARTTQTASTDTAQIRTETNAK